MFHFHRFGSTNGKTVSSLDLGLDRVHYGLHSVAPRCLGEFIWNLFGELNTNERAEQTETLYSGRLFIVQPTEASVTEPADSSPNKEREKDKSVLTFLHSLAIGVIAFCLLFDLPLVFSFCLQNLLCTSDSEVLNAV